MELKVKGLDFTSDAKTVIVSHKDREIAWNVSTFDRSNFEIPLFSQINGFWNQLPEDVQDRIFDVYARTRVVCSAGLPTTELTQQLYVLIKELYTYISLTDVTHWLRFHTDTHWPDSYKSAYEESQSSSGTREKTYLREDYIQLVGLSVTLRAMIPIWGDFIERTKDEAGTPFKEYYAYQLLAMSSLASSEPMQFLHRYVEHSVPADKRKDAAILGGISSEDFPTWIMSLVVIRRVAVGDVRGLDPAKDLVKYIYNYIKQKVNGHDNNFNGMVKEKIFEGAGQEGENSLSRLEGYKIKQEIPAGDIAILAQYMRDPIAVARRICPDVPMELLEASFESVKALATQIITKPQVTLMQWVLKPVISPRGLLQLNKPTSLNALAVTQALLWYRGYPELAGLVSGITNSNKETQQAGGGTSRGRIPKEMLERLLVLYPFVMRSGVKKQPMSKGSAEQKEKIQTVAETSIIELDQAFSAFTWRLTLPQEWVEVVTGDKNNRQYYVPHGIRIRLAKLAIEIAERSF